MGDLEVRVDKPIPYEFDLGVLSAFDMNPLDVESLKTNKDSYLKAVARDGTQSIINAILSLPIKSTADGQIVELPAVKMLLPREKPVPKPKDSSKWEKFAAKKGIAPKSKNGKLVYDEQTQEWVPKWGYKGKNKSEESQWLVEVDDKAAVEETNENPRTKQKRARKEGVKKNASKQRQNSERAALAGRKRSKR